MKTPRDCADALLPHRQPAAHAAEACAPANIALCKYWGKRNEALKLPLTGSLSIGLGPLGTRMRIETAEADALVLNGEPHEPDTPVFRRLFDFLDLFRVPGTFWRVNSENTIPTGAGLASSASAFAAAVRALDRLHAWNLPDWKRGVLARLGSGSACRSLYEGFAEWRPGLREDGLDSYAVPLRLPWPEFRIGILTLSAAPKPVGSTEAMRRTRTTAPLYAAWPDQVRRDLPRIRDAVYARDFPALGAAAEQNALAMHATMIGAWPPVLYWRPETVEVLHRVHALRADGLSLFATLDAGPNVKLLFTAPDAGAVQSAFPHLRVVAPFLPPPDSPIPSPEDV